MYMELNGSPCVLPAQLLREAEALPHLDFNLSDWTGKANAFHHQRGSDPSYGYLLVPSTAVNAASSAFSITYQDGTTKSFLVKIESAKKITPAYYEHQGYYLAKIVDERYALCDTLVSKRYNLVESFSPSQSSSSKGTFKYVKETIREVSPTLSVSYDWKELFKEVFKVPSGQELQVNGITFPTYTPQDLDWRYTSRRDALEMLLQWTGTSIVYQEGESNWKLVALEDANNANRDALLTQYDYSICKDRWNKFKEPGSPHPKKFRLHFRRLNPQSPDVDQYKVEEKTPSKSPKNGQEFSVRLPSYYVNDPSIPQSPSEVATDWFGRAEKFLSFFPSQEKTFRGWLFNPKGNDSTAYPMAPSAFIEKVSWFDIGDGPKTLCTSVTTRKWMPSPNEVSEPKARIAVGRVKGNVSSSQPTLQVRYLRSVAGQLPSGVEPNSTDGVTSYNTHKQEYVDGDTILIFSEEGKTIWDTDKSGGSGTGTVTFELSQDLAKTATSAEAYLLDETGQRVLVPNTSIELKITVFNPWQIHQGYGPRTDGLYGSQPGYRGHARGSNYEIIYMEGKARWIRGTTLNDVVPTAVSFPALIDKFFGASPNDRAPKTEVIEEGTSQSGSTYGVKVWDELDIIQETVKEETEYLAVLDEENDKYILTVIKRELKGVRFGVLQSTASAATGVAKNQRGIGIAQFYKDDGTVDGPTKTIANPFKDAFDNKSGCQFNMLLDPPEIVSVGCTVFAG